MKSFRRFINYIICMGLMMSFCYCLSEMKSRTPIQYHSASFYGLKQFHIDQEKLDEKVSHAKFWGVPSL